MIILFKKQINFILLKLLDQKYMDKINPKNLTTLLPWVITRIFKNEDRDIKEKYLKIIIQRYVDINFKLDPKFFNTLNRIIWKLKIELSAIEEHNLNLMEERIFSTFRHIKLLEVTQRKKKKEKVYSKFNDSNLYELRNDKLHCIYNGPLLITNMSFLFPSDAIEIKHSFDYKRVLDWELSEIGLKFEYYNEKKYLIRIHDNKTLILNFKNLINKKVKWLSKKINKVLI